MGVPDGPCHGSMNSKPRHYPFLHVKRSIQTNWRRPTLSAPVRLDPTLRRPVAAVSVPWLRHPQLQNPGRHGVGSLTRQATCPVHLGGFSDTKGGTSAGS